MVGILSDVILDLQVRVVAINLAYLRHWLLGEGLSRSGHKRIDIEKASKIVEFAALKNLGQG